jgi:predicted nuclease of predicted toxin-antitoxin system
MKFLVDMLLSPALADWLVTQGHDAVHASNAGLARAADSTILERARREQRVVITADLDYSRLLALTKAEQPGVILFRGGEYSEREAVERLAQAPSAVSTFAGTPAFRSQNISRCQFQLPGIGVRPTSRTRTP